MICACLVSFYAPTATNIRGMFFYSLVYMLQSRVENVCYSVCEYLRNMRSKFSAANVSILYKVKLYLHA